MKANGSLKNGWKKTILQNFKTINTMQPTQRTYTNVETGYKCRLYTSNDASQFHLIMEGNEWEGNEINGFYISAHTAADIKINGKKVVKLDMGNFYHLKEGETITHRKFCGFSNFSKI